MYTLMGYKPNSDDYCMGHRQASYGSDLKIFNSLSEEDLIKEWAAMKAYDKDTGEDGYDIIVYENGICVYDDFQNDNYNVEISENIINTVETLSQSIKSDRIEELKKEKIKNDKAIKQSREKDEHSTYLKLKEKFGS